MNELGNVTPFAEDCYDRAVKDKVDLRLPLGGAYWITLKNLVAVLIKYRSFRGDPRYNVISYNEQLIADNYWEDPAI